MIPRDSPPTNAIYFQSHFAAIFKDIGCGKSIGVRKNVLGRILDTSLLLPYHSDGGGNTGRLPHQPGRGNRHLSQDGISYSR